MITKVQDIDAYRISYTFAMDIFQLTRSFPKQEMYSLTDQLIRASCSISANIAEGWGKRIYENEFKKHLIYSMGSLEETQCWLLFAKDCKYLSSEPYEDLLKKADEMGAKIYKLHENWRSFQR